MEQPTPSAANPASGWRRIAPLVVVLLILAANLGGAVWCAVRANEHVRQAQQEKEEADAERVQAEVDKAQVEQQLTRTEWRLYASDLARAGGEWLGLKEDRALKILDSCRDDFRGWEYRYLRRLCDLAKERQRWATPGTFSSPEQEAEDWHQRMDARAKAQTVRLEAGKAPESLAFSPDGTQLAVTDAEGHGVIKLIDATGGVALIEERFHLSPTTCAGFSSDGKYLAWGDTEGWVCLLTLGTTSTVHGHVKHHGSVVKVAFAPDGRRLVSSSLDHTVVVWDLSEDKLLLKLVNAETGLMALSPDGTRLVTGCFDDRKKMKVWDATTGEELLTLEGHTGRVCCAAFSRDGKRLVSGDWNYTARVWDAQTGENLRTLEGHTKAVNSVCFSPDGQRIASGSDDCTVRLWNPSDGQQVLTLDGDGPVLSVAFSPDGNRLAACARRADVMIWDATPVDRQDSGR
jgi:dipeptidyl aminopeptidase/acylaminoacyl peptidase